MMGSKQRTGRVVAGLIVITLGVLFLLGTLDVIETNIGEILGWVASILLLAFGLGILIGRRLQQVFFPIVLIGIGLFILLSNLGVDTRVYLPIILILIGGAIALGGRRRSSSAKRDIGQIASTTSEGELDISCTLSEADKRVESHDFTGGNVNVTMGNVNLDLRAASVPNPPAILHASLTMGGLNLRVPSDWVIAIENDLTMGESEDKRTRTGSPSDTPHLTITGNVTMGSLVIDD